MPSMPRETQLTLVLCAGACIAGWFMPEYFYWTGADQSRSAPVVGSHGVLLVVLSLVAMACILMWHWNSQGEGETLSTSQALKQVNIRHLIVLTAMAACFIAFCLHEELRLLAASTALMPIGVALWIAFTEPPLRGQILAMLVCQFGPFWWLVRVFEELNGMDLSSALMVPLLPAIVPAELLARLIDVSRSSLGATASMLITLQIAVGVWLIRGGRKRALAYSLFLTTCSIASSFVLNALFRI